MIKGNLDYVLTSLPYLSFTDSSEASVRVYSIFKKYSGPSGPEKSLVTILENEVGKFLGPKANQMFQSVSLETIHASRFQKSKNSFVASFSKYMYDLKQEVKKLRMARKNNGKYTTNKAIQLDIVKGNPLEEEIQLLKLQWNALETLSMEHYTDFAGLVCYKLKLMLLMRLWSFDAQVGFERFVDSTIE